MGFVTGCNVSHFRLMAETVRRSETVGFFNRKPYDGHFSAYVSV
jgi:hypothetical protein